MKKEYLILTALILVLCAYLFLHKENRSNYELPEIPKTDTKKITGIVIEQEKGPIVFTKKDDKWTLTDNNYPADTYSIDNILAVFKNLKLSTLVSQEGDLGRYELDKAKHIRVKLMEKGKQIFELTMGKTAPTQNHTFVMLDDDKNIYHATGNFRSDFEKTVADFRDKKVMAFKKSAITRFSVAKDSLSKTIVAKKEKTDKDLDITTWTYEDGSLTDKKTISDLFSSLEDLECEKYINDPATENPNKSSFIVKIYLENNITQELTLSGSKEDENLKGTSSTNKHVFALSKFNSNQILSNIEKLLGIQNTEE